MKTCPFCGNAVTGPRRKYCSSYHGSAWRKTKDRRKILAALGPKCQECGSQDNLHVSVRDKTVRCGRHHIENSLRKFNERFPSKNPAKLASILGKETKLARKWELD